MKSNYHFAILGGIPGIIALIYTPVNLWQKNQQVSLDGILQVGNIGAFPDINKLDRATIKHAKNDSNELDFADFCKISKES